MASRVGRLGSVARLGRCESHGRELRVRRWAAARFCGRCFASGAAALVEVEVRDGLGLGRTRGGRLVDVEVVVSIGIEAEVVLGRTAGG
ncbi:MAG: hypothetical protein HY703_10605 [Gemmatimonadetes bacterium]|nr:hypothetical protein [Gemmatimonadota bacterium]